MAEWVYLALGSNLGDRDRLLADARNLVGQLPRTSVRAESSIEETEPLGPPGQPPYLNQMILIATELEPRELMNGLLDIERRLGRIRRERWGPRPIDLDIVRFGDREVREADLVIPHVELPNRPFWLRELAELTPHAG